MVELGEHLLQPRGSRRHRSLTGIRGRRGGTGISSRWRRCRAQGSASHGARKRISSKCSSQSRFRCLGPHLEFLLPRSPASRRSGPPGPRRFPASANAARRPAGAFSNSASSLASAGFFAGQTHCRTPTVSRRPAKTCGREDLFIGLFPQPGAERQQMPGEVAAVHAGNIERQERLERAGFIPIVEMPAIPLEPLHRGEGVAACVGSSRLPKDTRNPGRPDWRAAPGPCSWARCARRSSGRESPENCPAAASSPARRQRFRKNARSCGRCASERPVAPPSSPAPLIRWAG